VAAARESQDDLGDEMHFGVPEGARKRILGRKAYDRVAAGDIDPGNRYVVVTLLVHDSVCA